MITGVSSDLEKIILFAYFSLSYTQVADLGGGGEP